MIAKNGGLWYDIVKDCFLSIHMKKRERGQYGMTDDTSLTLDELKEWCDRVSSFEVGAWEDWPDIDLYMDQVISYLEHYMEYFRIYEDEKLITPSIINNNTKDGVLPKPFKKKYSRALLSNLLLFCITRQVLSGPELAAMLRELNTAEDFCEIHTQFGETLEQELIETVRTVSQHTDNLQSADRQQLARLAMALSLQAFSAGTTARKILSLLKETKDDCQ